LFNRVIKTPAGLYKYSWSEIFLVGAVFTKELGSRNLAGIDFDYLGYPFFILYFFLYFGRIVRLNAAPFGLYLYFIFTSLISITWLNLPLTGFFKQIIPIIVILSVSFTVLKNRSLVNVFELYVKITFWTAIFGLIQVLLAINGIYVLTIEKWRLDSIAYEPSHYAAILLPALVYCFLNIKRYKLYFTVMLAALILTFNLTAYFVFLTIFFIVSVHPLYLLVTVPLAYYMFFYILPNFSKDFSDRFFETYDTFVGRKSILNARLNVNSTTLSFYSNFEVAKFTLGKSPLLGSGLGGHEEMYYRRFANTAFQANYYYGLNAKAAHSLSIRILSELGLVGSALYLYTLVKSVLFARRGIHYAISLGCLSHFLCKFFKLGGYIDYGTPFFLTILLLNARGSFASQSQKSAAPRERHRVVSVQPAS
jgi:hypothetical protein